MTPSEPTQVLPPRPQIDTGAVVTVERDRRHHRLIKWLVAVVIIALVAVAAVITDQTFRARSEKAIAANIAESVGADESSVGVTIRNRPFLGVLLTDELQGLDATIPTATVARDETTVTFHDVNIHANGIRHAREESRTVAETMSATGRVNWPELSRLAGGKITYNDDAGANGKVTIVRDMSVLGARVGVSISAVPGVETTSRRAWTAFRFRTSCSSPFWKASQIDSPSPIWVICITNPSRRRRRDWSFPLSGPR